MRNYYKSYDSLAHAAEEIFNQSQTPEADPEPVIEVFEEETFEDISEDLEPISESKLVDMIKYSGAVGLFAKKVAKVITDEDEAALFPTGMNTRDGVAMQEILLNYIANKMGTDPKEKFGPYFDRVDLVGPGMSGKTALRGALDPRKKHKIKDLIKALKTFKEEADPELDLWIEKLILEDAIDDEKLAKLQAKFSAKAQKKLKKAQEKAKRQGKPVPRSYEDAKIKDPKKAAAIAMAKIKRRRENKLARMRGGSGF